MFYGVELANEAKARHTELLKQADEWRLAQRSRKHPPLHNKWSSTLLIWLGKQLIGWGRQLQRAT